MTVPTNEIIYSLDQVNGDAPAAQGLVTYTEFAVSVSKPVQYRRLMYSRWYATRKALPYSHRVRACHTMLLPSKKSLDVQINSKQKARITGHALCDNGWACPLCANKRSLALATKLNALLSHCLYAKKTVYFITLTMSHHRYESLTDTYNALKDSYRTLRKTRAFERFLVRSHFDKSLVVFTEITWGTDSGWHPHFHVLAFAEDGYCHGVDTHGMNKEQRERQIDKDNQERELHLMLLHSEFARHWLDALKKHKRTGIPDIAVDVKMSDKAVERLVEYLNDDGISEWKNVATGEREVDRGLVSEVTSSNKRGRVASLHAFDLASSHPDKFVEYVSATKGKQKVSGLDDAIARNDVPIDAGIVESDYVTLFSMTIDDWRTLIKSEGVATFLEFVEEKATPNT